MIDGPAFANINKPLQKMKNYGEYCDVQIAAALLTRLEEQHVKRVDVVFDVYRELSRKSKTREARGSRQSIRITVNEGTPTNG